MTPVQRRDEACIESLQRQARVMRIRPRTNPTQRAKEAPLSASVQRAPHHTPVGERLLRHKSLTGSHGSLLLARPVGYHLDNIANHRRSVAQRSPYACAAHGRRPRTTTNASLSPRSLCAGADALAGRATLAQDQHQQDGIGRVRDTSRRQARSA
jgi:hypothetical protein